MTAANQIDILASLMNVSVGEGSQWVDHLQFRLLGSKIGRLYITGPRCEYV